MSVQSVAAKYIELCSQGKHFDFMRAFYAPEIVSVEGDGKETAGKEPVIHKSEVWQGANNIHSQDLRGAFFCGDPSKTSGRFTVYVSVSFTPKSGRERITHEEVGVYTVKNDLVTREEFFYVGAFI